MDLLARRCRIPVFVELAGRIVRHRQAIDAALDHGLSQGLIESTNTKIVSTRVAFGFHSAEALIALAMLALGGHRPHCPDAPDPHHAQQREQRGPGVRSGRRIDAGIPRRLSGNNSGGRPARAR